MTRYQTTLDIDDIDYDIEYDYQCYEPPTYYPSDRANPGCQPYVDLISVEPYPDDPEVLTRLTSRIYDLHEVDP